MSLLPRSDAPPATYLRLLCRTHFGSRHANTATFSFIETVVLNPLPFEDQ